MKSHIPKNGINFLKRSIAVILTFIVMLNMAPISSMNVSAYSIPSESDFLNKLNVLRSKYPNNGTYSGTYYENGEAKAWTCYGYACQMMYEVFGARFYADGLYAKKDYTMGTIYAGDFIRLDAGYGPDTHSIFVTKVTDDRVYFTDGNYNNRNGIRWDASYSKSELARRFTYKVHIPGNTLTGNGVSNKPSKPTLQTPVVNADSITFRWNACEKADVYDLYIYKQSGEVQRVSYAMRTTQYTIPTEELPDGTYSAAAVSKNSGAGVWTYSDRVSFTVNNTRRIFLESESGDRTYKPKLSVPLDDVNGLRVNGWTFLYTSDYQKKTTTNLYGTELAVDKYGRIVAERLYGDENGLDIPDSGFVISMHSQNPYRPQMVVGNYAAFNRSNRMLYVYRNQDEYNLLTKTINRDEVIGKLPQLNRPGLVLMGWKMNGQSIDPYTTKLNSDAVLEAEWGKRGDADGNETVTPDDALSILMLVAGKRADIKKELADCDKDGKVTADDALQILMWIAGKPSTLTEELMIDETTFPDEAFRNCIKGEYGPDKDRNGSLSKEEIQGFTDLNVSAMNITDLSGVEYLTALRKLYCYDNQLTELDVRKNTALEELVCSYNQLTGLDVTKNTVLESLSCSRNQLAELDITKNTALKSLGCDANRLTRLDITKNTALKSLGCDANQLTELDITKNTVLESLSCGRNQLTGLDVTKNTALTELTCADNQLTGLDVTKNTVLERLSCGRNQLTVLDITKNTALRELYCPNNRLTGLDVRKNTALENLNCSNNQLTELDLTKNIALGCLWCEYNQLTELDVTKNTALELLWCENNQLTELDVTKNTALTELSASGNRYDIGSVSSFDLKNLPGNFDTAKASNWKGADYADGKLTNFFGNGTITYLYDIGNGRTETFTLIYTTE